MAHITPFAIMIAELCVSVESDNTSPFAVMMAECSVVQMHDLLVGLFPALNPILVSTALF